MADDHPLLTALDDDQLHLIRVIGRPWIVNDLADVKGWPTWDFVRRHFEKNHRAARRAEEVLASLPMIVSIAFAHGSSSYGLWWRADPSAGAMRPDERIGLTIAGLSRLDLGAIDDPRQRPDLARICLDIIRKAADKEADLAEDGDWSQVATGGFDLRTEYFGNEPPILPVELIGQVLMREYIPVTTRTTQFNYEVLYGNGKLTPLRGIRTVVQYLAVADTLVAAESAAADLPRSPLGLPAALDYLGLAVRVHPRWDMKAGFVDLPGFEAAASISQSPSGRGEFDQRCSDLWNVIGRLRVPKGSDAGYERHNWDPKNTGSLNRLVIWLEDEIGAEEFDSTCGQAISILRALGDIRQGNQHTSNETRVKRDRGLTRLGLPTVITDWSAAWSTVLDRSAGAVHALATAVRRTETPTQYVGS